MNDEFSSVQFSTIKMAWKWGQCSRNGVSAILAGIFFAIGWWIIIDVTCLYPLKSDFNKLYLFIGLVGTLALLLVNAVSNSRLGLGSNTFDEHCLSQCAARLILFLGFMLAFGCLITSVWLFVAYYLRYKRDQLYPGVAILAQNLAIFLSSMILRFGRREDDKC